jgi:hypothetical protein
MRLATDPVLPRNRLLRVDLLTLYLRATAGILRSLEARKNAIASSIGAMVVELSRGEVVLLGGSEACIERGCALTREAF